jgi:Arginine decarboxylase (spermidine biosynthesis)
MKVNPLPIIIEAILNYGEKYLWGFNTGSIGELRTLIKLADKYSPRILIYDGVVSESTIQDLLQLQKMGWRIIIDVESEREIELLAKYPQFEIGIRVKPLVKLHGKWSGSVGLSSKFGLTTNALMKLKSEYKYITENQFYYICILVHRSTNTQISGTTSQKLNKYIMSLNTWVLKIYQWWILEEEWLTHT